MDQSMTMQTTREKVMDHPGSSNRIFIGEVRLLDEAGGVLRAWRPNRAVFSIGSDSRCDVRLQEGSSSRVHAEIVFGKNRTLIRAVDLPIRLAGRLVRETLIDEPTTIQLGQAKLLIVPPAYAGESNFPGHAVLPGSVAEQASRIRRDRPSTLIDDGNKSESLNPRNPSLVLETPSVADLSSKFAEVLAPIQQALADTQRGIDSLHQRVVAGEARVAESVQPVALPDISSVMSQIDERIGTFTTQCESLLSDARNNFDDRFHQLNEWMQKLSEVSQHAVYPSPTIETDAKVVDSRYSQDVQGYASADACYENPYSPNAVAGQAESTESNNFDEEPASDQSAHDEASWQPAPEPLSYEAVHEFEDSSGTNEDTDPSQGYSYESTSFSNNESSSNKSFDSSDSLPSWFANDALLNEKVSLPMHEAAKPGSHVSEEDNEPYEQSIFDSDPKYSSWLSARLNPEYAEDTGGLIEQASFEESATNPELASAPGWYREEDAGDSEAVYSDSNASESAADTYSDNATFSKEESLSEAFATAAYGEASTFEESSYDEPLAEVYEEPAPRAYQEAVQQTYEEPVRQVGSGEANEEVEESIEDYMQRLLQRVKSGPGSEQTASKAVVQQPSSPSKIVASSGQSASAPVVARTSSRTEEEVAVVDSQSVHDTNLVQEKPAPEVEKGQPIRQSTAERSETLAALRDLANQTARTAIHKSSKKRLEISVATKFCISLMGLAGGLILLFLNGFDANIAMLGMICSFIVCLLWGYEASVQAGQLLKTNAKNPARSS
jgi:hypothetical protein